MTCSAKLLIIECLKYHSNYFVWFYAATNMLCKTNVNHGMCHSTNRFLMFNKLISNIDNHHMFIFWVSVVILFTVFFLFPFPSYSTKHSGIGHAMVNKLHCSVDIIQIVCYFGCAISFLFLSFICKHHLQKKKKKLGKLKIFVFFYFSIQSSFSFLPSSLFSYFLVQFNFKLPPLEGSH